MREKIPEIDIAQILSPPMDFDPVSDLAEEAISSIGANGAWFVFLALGAPKQEVFAVKASTVVKDVGFLSIGAGLDFLGEQIRAPRWIRAMAAEWLWRMLLNPKRLFPRYAACMLALPGLTVRALMARWDSV